MTPKTAEPAKTPAIPTQPEVIGPATAAVELLVNGSRELVRVDPAMTLAEVLRDQLGLTGTKIGCDRGACSACTVWLDGEVAASCMTLALDARGRAITTIEGLARRRRRSTRCSRPSSSTTPCSAASARRAW